MIKSRRLPFAIALLAGMAAPSLAQNPPVIADKKVERLTLRAVFTFGSAHPGSCTAEQSQRLHEKIVTTLDIFSERLVAEAKAINPDVLTKGGVMELRMTGGCGAGGGLTVGGEAPDSPLRFEYYQPGEGWRIIG